MRTRIRLWLITTTVFAVFGLLAWVFRFVAGDAVGDQLWRYRWAIVGLGVVMAGAVYRFLATRWKSRIRGEKAAAREDELAATFKAARKRLAASPKAAEKTVRKLPVVLVLGPRASTKTTVIEESGLDLELLAGEPRRGDDVVATEAANLWYADGTVVIEAGGPLLDDAEKWEALLAHAQPARWAAAFGFEKQASRAALVCVSCDELLQPGAAETVPALARKIRDRLVEASEALGIRLPVYVLFTQADRLPYYDDFVRSLGRDEAAAALGATLPLTPPGSAPHAEAEGARIDRYLGELLHALALKRREFLARESDPAVLAGVYEFPRELTKLRDHVRRFLVELCRPSQLGRSPFLRSFHFTGVRALEVDDGSPVAPAAPAAGAEPALGATAVFNPAELQAAAAAAARASRGRTRRIPDWAFLRPFFRNVLFADDNARLTTAGGARVDILRRGLLTTVGLAGVVWMIGLVVSFFGNRGLAQRVEAGVAEVEAHEFRAEAFPQLDQLQRLELLRDPLAEIRGHQVDGRPLGLRWGLYRGEALMEPGLRSWLRAFRASLGRTAQDRVYTRISGLPVEPSEASEYTETFNALKAYLIVTSHPDRSSVAFLPDALLVNWAEAGGLDEAGAELLRLQLEFFADVIRDGAPFAPAPDEAVVDSARAFLARFAGEEQLYSAVLETAAEFGQEVRLASAVPAAAGVLQGDYVVPAHFTLGAWEHLHALDLDEFFSSESWVMGGESTVSPERREQLRAEITRRYEAEYARAWQDFLASVQVGGFGSASVAATRLGQLSGGRSPLFDVLVLASRNTQPLAGDVFQPLDTVAPHEPDSPLVGPWNQEYADALQGLGMALDAVATTPDNPMALQQAQGAASQAGTAVNSLARGFIRDPEGADRTGEAVAALLNSPIQAARRLVDRIPAAGANATGEQFCSQFGGLLSGYPFQPSAREVALDDVAAALQPGQSLLSGLEQELQGLIRRTGNRFQTQPGSDVRVTDEFLTFLTRASTVAEALFDASGELRVPFQLRPQPTGDLDEVTIVFGNLRSTFTQTDQPRNSFNWPGESLSGARIEGSVGGRTVTLVDGGNGPWALYRLFEGARWEPLQASGQQYRLTWNVPNHGVVLVARLDIAAGVPLFQSSYLQGLRCPRPLAR